MWKYGRNASLKNTNTLVLISDYTKGIYHDKWIGGVLHYTGMGKSGDQDIHWSQNATLADCVRNGVDVHLFEVMDVGEHIYCGRIELVSKPYTEIQPGEDGNDRIVWMFPIRPVPDNAVQKPQMFVFKDMDDYKSRGKNVDVEYAKMIADKKKNKSKAPVVVQPVIPKPEPKPTVVIPADIVEKQDLTLHQHLPMTMAVPLLQPISWSNASFQDLNNHLKGNLKSVRDRYVQKMH